MAVAKSYGETILIQKCGPSRMFPHDFPLTCLAGPRARSFLRLRPQAE